MYINIHIYVCVYVCMSSLHLIFSRPQGCKSFIQVTLISPR